MDKQFVFEEYQRRWKQPKITTYEQVMRLVTLNDSVRQWYADLKEQEATLTVMPEAFKDAGMTAEMWDDLKASRDIIKDATQKYNTTVRNAAAEFKAKLQLASKERNYALDKVPMIVRLTSFTQNNLPESMQIELALIEDDKKRSKRGKELCKAYVTQCVKTLLEGGELKTDPFQ
jgi:hypothetical protein